MSRTADAAAIARDIQREEGWTDSTLLGLVLGYVQNQDANDAFRDYLKEHSEGGPRTREAGGQQPSGGGAAFTPGPWPTSEDVPPAERA